MKKLFVVLTLIICMLASAVPAFGASFDSFADAQTHWAKASLERAVNENILNGSNGQLYPNGNLKGSEMATIMVRQLDLQTYTDAYTGTTESDWFYRYAAIASYAGLISEEDALDLNVAVTRDQVFQVYAKAYFTDSQIDQMIKKQEADAAKKAEELKKQQEAQAKAEAEAAAKAESEADATETADVVVVESTEETATAPEAVTVPEGFDRFTDADQFTVEGKAAAELLFDAGIVQGDDLNMLNPQKQITRAEFVTMLFRAADKSKAVVADKGLKITLNAPDVDPDAMVKADAAFNGVSGAITGDIQWYFDGAARENFAAAGKSIKNGDKTDFSANVEWTRNMNCFRRVGLDVTYTENGKEMHKYAEKVVTIENYPSSHYWEAVYQEALQTVSCVYAGDYTSSYNIDYSTEIKEAYINGKGYSSKTQYLLWVNLATQKVNVFTGSEGDWELIKTFRCASGAKSTPTPTGVSYVTYKQNGWYTDKYICKPVVRFYPGTGYAFHSVLLDPKGSGRIIDGSMGFPVSHGCIRMMPSDINWLHATIPVNTTVVIY
ncbi:MAG: S-layer homology domain-containing protein [Firmicutes bacterium]|nr:S-layer homology domain-containing protein [Bacillota bacterium]